MYYTKNINTSYFSGFERLIVIVLFAKPTKRFYRDPWLKAADLLGVSADQAKRLTQSRREFAELIRQRFDLTP